MFVNQISLKFHCLTATPLTQDCPGDLNFVAGLGFSPLSPGYGSRTGSPGTGAAPARPPPEPSGAGRGSPPSPRLNIRANSAHAHFPIYPTLRGASPQLPGSSHRFAPLFPPPACLSAGAVRVVTRGGARQRPEALSLPSLPPRNPRGRGDPTAQTRFRPPPAARPPSDAEKRFFPCRHRSPPFTAGRSGPRCRAPRLPPAAPRQRHLPPRCGARSGAPGPARPRYLLRRGEPEPRGAERSAGRRGAAGRAARLPRPSPACPPARGAPRRPVTRSGTREGTGKGAKSFKNMSHAHIKFKFTSRPPPAAIGGRGSERGAAGARRARHWLRGTVTHPPGDMTDTKLLRHSLGNASP